MAIYMFRDYTPPVEVTDYVAESLGDSSSRNNVWYGMYITAKIDCKINKVIFGGPITGRLKIAQGSNASASGTTYSINNVSEYSLGTPFQLSADTTYTVSVNVYNSGEYMPMYFSSSITFPVDGTNIKFNDGVEGINHYNYAYNIKGLTTLANE